MSIGAAAGSNQNPAFWNRSGSGREADVVETAKPLYALLFTVAVLLRIGLSGTVLNMFVNYSDPGGTLIFKIYPGSYMLIGLGLIASGPVLRGVTIRRNPMAIGTLALLLTPPLMLVWSLLLGRSGGLGYLIDLTLIGPMVLISLAYLTPQQRLSVCNAVVAFLALNSLVVLFEFITKIRIMPYPYREASFRPAGILGHPLATGTLHVAIIPALFLLPYKRSIQWGISILLALSVAASQVRLGTMVCGVTLVFVFFVTVNEDARKGRHSTALSGLIVTLVLMFVPIVGAYMYISGFFDRLLLGFADESTQSRILVYQVFDYMSRDQFLYGMDLARATYYVQKGLKIDRIESAVVVFIINFGAIGGIFVLINILLYSIGLAYRAPMLAKLVVLLLLVLVLSNNGLASKGVSLAFLALFTFGAATARKDVPLTPKERGPTAVRDASKGRG